MRKMSWRLLFMSLLSIFFSSHLPSWSSELNNSLSDIESVYEVIVKPGSNIQELVDHRPPGTTFRLQPGIHQLQQIKPKPRDSFIGLPGAILSGAMEIQDFIQQGKYWVAEVAVPDIPQKGRCQKHQDGTLSNGCKFANDLFIDNLALIQVSRLSLVEPGTWFLDIQQNKVYIAENPKGKKLEISLIRYAFYGNANKVTIRNLIIEKYANPAQEGAIHPLNDAQGSLGKHWKVERNEIRLNHGVGIRLGHYMQITNNHVHHNGQLGLGGAGNAILVETNEIAYNNTQRFDSHWEAGGSKFSRTDNLTVRGNYVHHNQGPGLWTDGNNIHTLYEGNRVQENAGPGIFHEISYEAVIKNNIVERNGFERKKWVDGAGILVTASRDVEIFGNSVKDNSHGICATQTKRGKGGFGPYEIHNLHVHDNHIAMMQGVTGLVIQNQDMSYFTDRNNRFQRNSYVLSNKNMQSFRWKKSALTYEGWNAFGQDLKGSLKTPN